MGEGEKSEVVKTGVDETPGWKQRASREMLKYWIYFVYLAVFFGAFTWYRRLILAEYHITYLHYGVAVIEAMVMAKVILVGDALRLGNRFEGKPLIVSALYKTLLFSLFVGAFAIVEHMIAGWLDGRGLIAGFRNVINEGKDELLARCLLTFCSFIPFFAFKELAHVLGNGKLSALFFARR
jgi:hypothetical protein